MFKRTENPQYTGFTGICVNLAKQLLVCACVWLKMVSSVFSACVLELFSSAPYATLYRYCTHVCFSRS